MSDSDCTSDSYENNSETSSDYSSDNFLVEGSDDEQEIKSETEKNYERVLIVINILTEIMKDWEPTK